MLTPLPASDEVPVTVIVPAVTVAPDAGDVIEIDGGVVSRTWPRAKFTSELNVKPNELNKTTASPMASLLGI